MPIGVRCMLDAFGCTYSTAQVMSCSGLPHNVDYLISKMLSDIRIITSVTQLVSDMRSTCTCISYYIICKSALIRVQLLDLEFEVHQLQFR